MFPTRVMKHPIFNNLRNYILFINTVFQCCWDLSHLARKKLKIFFLQISKLWKSKKQVNGVTGIKFSISHETCTRYIPCSMPRWQEGWLELVKWQKGICGRRWRGIQERWSMNYQIALSTMHPGNINFTAICRSKKARGQTDRQGGLWHNSTLPSPFWELRALQWKPKMSVKSKLGQRFDYQHWITPLPNTLSHHTHQQNRQICMNTLKIIQSDMKKSNQKLKKSWIWGEFTTNPGEQCMPIIPTLSTKKQEGDHKFKASLVSGMRHSKTKS